MAEALHQDRIAQARIDVCNRQGCQLWVSTALETLQLADPENQPEDLVQDGNAYRRLSPDYYLWLKTRFERFEKQVGKSDRVADEVTVLRLRFKEIRAAAKQFYTIADLREASKRLSSLPMVSPNKAVCTKLERITFAHPVGEDPELPCSCDVTVNALAKVDAIRDQALALSWSEARLYQNRGRFSFPYGQDYGLVCFVGEHETIGQVTRQSIELVQPSGNVLRFYNPDVEQPWFRKPNNHEHINAQVACAVSPATEGGRS